MAFNSRSAMPTRVQRESSNPGVPCDGLVHWRRIMLLKVAKSVAGVGAAIFVLAIAAAAQTGQVEGTVKLKGEDNSMKPVPGALVEIYRLDIKGKYEAKTDKTGHYVRLGLPLQGTYLFVASGPGIQPTWTNNVKVSQMPV